MSKPEPGSIWFIRPKYEVEFRNIVRFAGDEPTNKVAVNRVEGGIVVCQVDDKKSPYNSEYCINIEVFGKWFSPYLQKAVQIKLSQSGPNRFDDSTSLSLEREDRTLNLPLKLGQSDPNRYAERYGYYNATDMVKQNIDLMVELLRPHVWDYESEEEEANDPETVLWGCENKHEGWWEDFIDTFTDYSQGGIYGLLRNYWDEWTRLFEAKEEEKAQQEFNATSGFTNGSLWQAQAGSQYVDKGDYVVSLGTKDLCEYDFINPNWVVDSSEVLEDLWAVCQRMKADPAQDESAYGYSRRIRDAYFGSGEIFVYRWDDEDLKQLKKVFVSTVKLSASVPPLNSIWVAQQDLYVNEKNEERLLAERKLDGYKGKSLQKGDAVSITSADLHWVLIKSQKYGWHCWVAEIAFLLWFKPYHPGEIKLSTNINDFMSSSQTGGSNEEEGLLDPGENVYGLENQNLPKTQIIAEQKSNFGAPPNRNVTSSGTEELLSFLGKFGELENRNLVESEIEASQSIVLPQIDQKLASEAYIMGSDSAMIGPISGLSKIKCESQQFDGPKDTNLEHIATLKGGEYRAKVDLWSHQSGPRAIPWLATPVMDRPLSGPTVHRGDIVRVEPYIEDEFVARVWVSINTKFAWNKTLYHVQMVNFNDWFEPVSTIKLSALPTQKYRSKVDLWKGPYRLTAHKSNARDIGSYPLWIREGQVVAARLHSNVDTEMVIMTDPSIFCKTEKFNEWFKPYEEESIKLSAQTKLLSDGTHLTNLYAFTIVGYGDEARLGHPLEGRQYIEPDDKFIGPVGGRTRYNFARGNKWIVREHEWHQSNYSYRMQIRREGPTGDVGNVLLELWDREIENWFQPIGSQIKLSEGIDWRPPEGTTVTNKIPFAFMPMNQVEPIVTLEEKQRNYQQKHSADYPAGEKWLVYHAYNPDCIKLQHVPTEQWVDENIMSVREEEYHEFFQEPSWQIKLSAAPLNSLWVAKQPLYYARDVSNSNRLRSEPINEDHLPVVMVGDRIRILGEEEQGYLVQPEDSFGPSGHTYYVSQSNIDEWFESVSMSTVKLSEELWVKSDKPKYILPGEEGFAIMPWSEVCMHMKVSDKPMHFRFKENGRGVQLLNEYGGNYSSSITPGEAGLFYDQGKDQYYYYPAVHPPKTTFHLSEFNEREVECLKVSVAADMPPFDDLRKGDSWLHVPEGRRWEVVCKGPYELWMCYQGYYGKEDLHWWWMPQEYNFYCDKGEYTKFCPAPTFHLSEFNEREVECLKVSVARDRDYPLMDEVRKGDQWKFRTTGQTAMVTALGMMGNMPHLRYSDRRYEKGKLDDKEWVLGPSEWSKLWNDGSYYDFVPVSTVKLSSSMPAMEDLRVGDSWEDREGGSWGGFERTGFERTVTVAHLPGQRSVLVRYTNQRNAGRNGIWKDEDDETHYLSAREYEGRIDRGNYRDFRPTYKVKLSSDFPPFEQLKKGDSWDFWEEFLVGTRQGTIVVDDIHPSGDITLRTNLKLVFKDGTEEKTHSPTFKITEVSYNIAKDRHCFRNFRPASTFKLSAQSAIFNYRYGDILVKDGVQSLYYKPKFYGSDIGYEYSLLLPYVLWQGPDGNYLETDGLPPPAKYNEIELEAQRIIRDKLREYQGQAYENLPSPSELESISRGKLAGIYRARYQDDILPILFLKREGVSEIGMKEYRPYYSSTFKLSASGFEFGKIYECEHAFPETVGVIPNESTFLVGAYLGKVQALSDHPDAFASVPYPIRSEDRGTGLHRDRREASIRVIRAVVQEMKTMLQEGYSEQQLVQGDVTDLLASRSGYPFAHIQNYIGNIYSPVPKPSTRMGEYIWYPVDAPSYQVKLSETYTKQELCETDWRLPTGSIVRNKKVFEVVDGDLHEPSLESYEIGPDEELEEDWKESQVSFSSGNKWQVAIEHTPEQGDVMTVYRVEEGRMRVPWGRIVITQEEFDEFFWPSVPTNQIKLSQEVPMVPEPGQLYRWFDQWWLILRISRTGSIKVLVAYTLEEAQEAAQFMQGNPQVQSWSVEDFQILESEKAGEIAKKYGEDSREYESFEGMFGEKGLTFHVWEEWRPDLEPVGVLQRKQPEQFKLSATYQPGDIFAYTGWNEQLKDTYFVYVGQNIPEQLPSYHIFLCEQTGYPPATMPEDPKMEVAQKLRHYIRANPLLESEEHISQQTMSSYAYHAGAENGFASAYTAVSDEQMKYYRPLQVNVKLSSYDLPPARIELFQEQTKWHGLRYGAIVTCLDSKETVFGYRNEGKAIQQAFWVVANLRCLHDDKYWRRGNTLIWMDEDGQEHTILETEGVTIVRPNMVKLSSQDFEVGQIYELWKRQNDLWNSVRDPYYIYIGKRSNFTYFLRFHPNNLESANKFREIIRRIERDPSGIPSTWDLYDNKLVDCPHLGFTLDRGMREEVESQLRGTILERIFPGYIKVGGEMQPVYPNFALKFLPTTQAQQIKLSARRYHATGNVYQVQEVYPEDAGNDEDWYEYEVTLWEDETPFSGWDSFDQLYNGIDRLNKQEAQDALADSLREINEEGKVTEYFEVEDEPEYQVKLSASQYQPGDLIRATHRSNELRGWRFGDLAVYVGRASVGDTLGEEPIATEAWRETVVTLSSKQYRLVGEGQFSRDDQVQLTRLSQYVKSHPFGNIGGLPGLDVYAYEIERAFGYPFMSVHWAAFPPGKLEVYFEKVVLVQFKLSFQQENVLNKLSGCLGASRAYLGTDQETLLTLACKGLLERDEHGLYALAEVPLPIEVLRKEFPVDSRWVAKWHLTNAHNFLLRPAEYSPDDPLGGYTVLAVKGSIWKVGGIGTDNYGENPRVILRLVSTPQVSAGQERMMLVQPTSVRQYFVAQGANIKLSQPSDSREAPIIGQPYVYPDHGNDWFEIHIPLGEPDRNEFLYFVRFPVANNPSPEFSRSELPYESSIKGAESIISIVQQVLRDNQGATYLLASMGWYRLLEDAGLSRKCFEVVWGGNQFGDMVSWVKPLEIKLSQEEDEEEEGTLYRDPEEGERYIQRQVYLWYDPGNKELREEQELQGSIEKNGFISFLEQMGQEGVTDQEEIAKRWDEASNPENMGMTLFQPGTSWTVDYVGEGSVDLLLKGSRFTRFREAVVAVPWRTFDDWFRRPFKQTVKLSQDELRLDEQFPLHSKWVARREWVRDARTDKWVPYAHEVPYRNMEKIEEGSQWEVVGWDKSGGELVVVERTNMPESNWPSIWSLSASQFYEVLAPVGAVIPIKLSEELLHPGDIFLDKTVGPPNYWVYMWASATDQRMGYYLITTQLENAQKAAYAAQHPSMQWSLRAYPQLHFEDATVSPARAYPAQELGYLTLIRGLEEKAWQRWVPGSQIKLSDKHSWQIELERAQGTYGDWHTVMDDIVTEYGPMYRSVLNYEREHYYLSFADREWYLFLMALKNGILPEVDRAFRRMRTDSTELWNSAQEFTALQELMYQKGEPELGEFIEQLEEQSYTIKLSARPENELPVIFRKDRADGVFAIYPTVFGDAYGSECMYYTPQGGHGSGHPSVMIQGSTPARPEEYAELLEQIHQRNDDWAYKVYSKIQQWMNDERREEARQSRRRMMQGPKLDIKLSARLNYPPIGSKWVAKQDLWPSGSSYWKVTNRPGPRGKAVLKGATIEIDNHLKERGEIGYYATDEYGNVKLRYIDVAKFYEWFRPSSERLDIKLSAANAPKIGSQWIAKGNWWLSVSEARWTMYVEGEVTHPFPTPNILEGTQWIVSGIFALSGMVKLKKVGGPTGPTRRVNIAAFQFYNIMESYSPFKIKLSASLPWPAIGSEWIAKGDLYYSNGEWQFGFPMTGGDYEMPKGSTWKVYEIYEDVGMVDMQGKTDNVGHSPCYAVRLSQFYRVMAPVGSTIKLSDLSNGVVRNKQALYIPIRFSTDHFLPGFLADEQDYDEALEGAFSIMVDRLNVGGLPREEQEEWWERSTIKEDFEKSYIRIPAGTKWQSKDGEFCPLMWRQVAVPVWFYVPSSREEETYFENLRIVKLSADYREGQVLVNNQVLYTQAPSNLVMADGLSPGYLYDQVGYEQALARLRRSVVNGVPGLTSAQQDQIWEGSSIKGAFEDDLIVIDKGHRWEVLKVSWPHLTVKLLDPGIELGWNEAGVRVNLRVPTDIAEPLHSDWFDPWRERIHLSAAPDDWEGRWAHVHKGDILIAKDFAWYLPDKNFPEILDEEERQAIEDKALEEFWTDCSNEGMNQEQIDDAIEQENWVGPDFVTIYPGDKWMVIEDRGIVGAIRPYEPGMGPDDSLFAGDVYFNEYWKDIDKIFNPPPSVIPKLSEKLPKIGSKWTPELSPMRLSAAQDYKVGDIYTWTPERLADHRPTDWGTVITRIEGGPDDSQWWARDKEEALRVQQRVLQPDWNGIAGSYLGDQELRKVVGRDLYTTALNLNLLDSSVSSKQMMKYHPTAEIPQSFKLSIARNTAHPPSKIRLSTTNDFPEFWKLHVGDKWSWGDLDNPNYNMVMGFGENEWGVRFALVDDETGPYAELCPSTYKDLVVNGLYRNFVPRKAPQSNVRLSVANDFPEFNDLQKGDQWQYQYAEDEEDNLSTETVTVVKVETPSIAYLNIVWICSSLFKDRNGVPNVREIAHDQYRYAVMTGAASNFKRPVQSMIRLSTANDFPEFIDLRIGDRWERKHYLSENQESEDRVYYWEEIVVDKVYPPNAGNLEMIVQTKSVDSGEKLCVRMFEYDCWKDQGFIRGFLSPKIRLSTSYHILAADPDTLHIAEQHPNGAYRYVGTAPGNEEQYQYALDHAAYSNNGTAWVRPSQMQTINHLGKTAEPRWYHFEDLEWKELPVFLKLGV